MLSSRSFWQLSGISHRRRRRSECLGSAARNIRTVPNGISLLTTLATGLLLPLMFFQPAAQQRSVQRSLLLFCGLDDIVTTSGGILERHGLRK